MNNKMQELANKNIGKLLWEFSLPAIIGMLVNALYNIVDRIFIGHTIGAAAISGMSVTFPIMIITMAFGMLVGVGAGALVSIKLGEQDKAEAQNILGNAFTLLTIISITISVIGLTFMDPLLAAFGISEDTLNYAQQYLSIILLGTVFQNLGFGLNNLIRAEGSPQTAMYSMLIGAIINFILDPIFIFIFHLGVKGTAIATVISQLVVTIWVIYHFNSKKSLLKLTLPDLSLKFNIIKAIFAIGMAPFLMQLASSVVNIFLNASLIRYGGDIAVGAMGVIISLSMLIFMPIFGICQGVQPIIGYNFGAKNFSRVKEAQILAMSVATIISIVGFIFIEFFPKVLISIFNASDNNLITVGTQGLRIFLAMFPLIGFQIVSTNYFQAIGKAKISMVLSLLRQVVLLLPLLYILPRYLGLNGVWLAAPIADIGSALITGFFIRKELQKLSA